MTRRKPTITDSIKNWGTRCEEDTPPTGRSTSRTNSLRRHRAPIAKRQAKTTDAYFGVTRQTLILGKYLISRDRRLTIQFGDLFCLAAHEFHEFGGDTTLTSVPRSTRGLYRSRSQSAEL